MTTMNWTVSPWSIGVMVLVALVAVALPVGLGLFFHRRTQGRWRYFLLGCAVFPLFALVLEGQAHSLILGGSLGPAIQGNLWLYGLYGGLMAGLFEECGRWLAFRATRRGLRGPQDGLMYGAGHGGMEAVLVLVPSMASNVVLSLAMNRGGLAGVEELVGTIPDTLMPGLTSLVTAAPVDFLWGGVERVVAVALHISLSLLVYAAATRKGNWYWLPVAIGLHTLVNGLAVVVHSYCPIWVVELMLAVLVLAVALVARRVYFKEKAENT